MAEIVELTLPTFNHTRLRTFCFRLSGFSFPPHPSPLPSDGRGGIAIRTSNACFDCFLLALTAGVVLRFGVAMIATLSNLKVSLPMPQIAAFCRRWNMARLEVVGAVPAYSA